MQNRSLVIRLLSGALFVCLAAASQAQAGLWVDLKDSTKTMADVYSQTDAAVRLFNKNASLLTADVRTKMRRAGRFRNGIQFSLPTVVRLAINGTDIPPFHSHANGDLVLQFDNSGSRSFPPAYQAALQAAFDQAKGTMNVVFGKPAQGGTVLVKNYDADIGDRDAVAGGYFLPNNGAGQMEIRFPIYNSPESAAVNFVHVLLLAYMGPNAYKFDAFEEGLARAGTMKVVRTAGAMPANLDPNQIEAVLESTYDVGAFYDWYNQRALGASQFIAVNLRSVPLPPGGSLGGIYLLRYQMAGSAWYKALVQNAGFIAQFNQLFYANPAIAGNIPALIANGQQVLNTLEASANGTLEGLSFANWFQRQFVLETKDTLGTKLLVQPIPLSAEFPGDFGVFDVSATYFETNPGANEVLLSGQSYPVFLDSDGNRVFPSSQDDLITISGAFGSVTPNFPDLFGGANYRMTVDVPVLDKLARVYLPAGSYSVYQGGPTGPNNLFGTVEGLSASANAHLKVTIGAVVQDNIPIRNFAFGFTVPSATGFNQAQRLKVEVVVLNGALNQTVLTRYVNKGPGMLGLDLRVGGDTTFTTHINKGIQTIGFPIDPYASEPAAFLGVPANQLLLARYNASTASYDFYPDTGPIVQGLGYFFRSNTGQDFTFSGETSPNTEISVALRPGWNMITTPINSNVSTNNIRIAKPLLPPELYGDALGVDIGNDFFAFQPGAADGASGVPETGTMVPATTFAPGQSYFVRVLNPLGIVMYFAPTPPNGHAHFFPQTGWRMLLTSFDGSFRSTTIIGQSNTGSRAFDAKEDSLIPPGIGGFQSYVVATGGRLYRDVRHVNTGDTYNLTLEGLKAGKTYSVNFRTVMGTMNVFAIKTTQVPYRTMHNGDTFTFVAKGSSQTIQVLINGGQ